MKSRKITIEKRATAEEIYAALGITKSIKKTAKRALRQARKRHGGGAGSTKPAKLSGKSRN